ncbi:MAG: transcription antitermination factor NusB [Candidatus Euphemobacter frigidus]|nr:transcription antitermination factor NusB [Candidatus Euphemobacter frigidus]MDP8275094.1 transcription antitermination factor NusB [Candidatus Euphemobacter frigidus]
MGQRRQARELALQFLYGYDLNRKDLDETLSDFWNVNRAPDKVRRFAGELIRGTIEQLDRVDGIIADHARNWRLDRIALVDKNILRLSIYELKFRDDIPPLVSINEAVEIAKKFSTAQSGQFVNGILDQVRQEIKT